MNSFNSIRSFFGRMRSSAHLDPVRDWIVLLTSSILAFISIVIWNVLAFDTIARGGIIGTTEIGTEQVFNRSSIDAIHDVFSKRASEEVKYVTGVYRYADPSQ